MDESVRRIDAKTLKSNLHDGGEIALLDARDEVPFEAQHILVASNVPLGRLEEIVATLVPRRGTRIVWCDDSGDGGGPSLADRAAARMIALGYRDVSVLDGGISAWEASGYRLYSGMHVPSKAFAEVIEHEAGTPYITAEELKSMLDNDTDMVLFDSRSYEEYNVNSIPTAISVPGAELVYRFKDMVPSPDTTVVVNCGGRTRSIIGAQALISAGVPNKVVSLKNGTQGWHLAGFDVIDGATRGAPDVSPEGLAAAKAAADNVAQAHGIAAIDLETLQRWQKEADDKALYVLDVRTATEYEAGHLAGAKHIPGGQLVQETDRHLGIWGARVVLVDDCGVRATMTAYWLKQMGWDVVTLAMDGSSVKLQSGPYKAEVLGLDEAKAATIDAVALNEQIASGNVVVVDLAMSRAYERGHIPGAWFAMRTRLAEDLTRLPKDGDIVFTSPDGALARLAAADAAVLTGRSVAALDGGTAAWQTAGLALAEGRENMAGPADDIKPKAREQSEGKEEAMRAYLAWEIDLVNQMATDDDQRFDVMTG